jgi:hypothetical protein
MTDLQNIFLKAIENDLDLSGGQYPDAIRVAEACESILKEKMGEALEWADAEGYKQVLISGNWRNTLDHKIPEDKRFTTRELIDLFLKENK